MKQLIAVLISFIIAVAQFGALYAQDFELIDHVFQIRDFKVNYPEATVTTQVMVNGIGIKQLQKNNNINIFIKDNNKPLYYKIVPDTSIKKITLRIILYLKKLDDETLGQIQTIVNHLKNQYPQVTIEFWVPVNGLLRKLPFKRLYNKMFFQNVDKQIAGIISNYLKKNEAISGSGDIVHLFIGKFKKIKYADSLNHALIQAAQLKGHWFAIIYMDKNKQFPPQKNTYFLKRCLLIEKYNLKTIEMDLQQMLQNLLDSYQHVHFQLIDPNPNRLHRTISFLAVMDGDTLKEDISIQLPRKKVEKTYVNYQLTQLSKNDSTWNYIQKMDSLKHYYRVVPADTFRSLAYHVLSIWANNILQNKNYEQVPLWNEKAKKEWDMDTQLPQQYKQIAFQLYSQYLKYRQIRGASLEEQIQLYDRLIALKPDDRELRRKNTLLRAQLMKEEGELWRAARLYRIALEEFHDNRVRQTLNSVLKIAFQKAYKNQEWRVIIEKQKEYNNYIRNQFFIRFTIAQAYRYRQQWQQAARHWEWLIRNWQQQNFLTWNEAFEILQNIYFQALEFDNAYALIKQLYQKHPTKHQYLIRAAIILRAKYIAPFIQILPVWYQRNQGNKEHLVKILQSIKKNYWPQYVQGIAILNNQQQIVYTVQPLNIKSISLKKVRAFPTLIRAPDGNRDLLIQRLSDGYLVVAISHEIQSAEQGLIQKIRETPGEEKPWFSFFNYVHHQSLSTTATLITALLGNDWSNHSILSLKPYWRVLKKYPYIQYLAVHKANGELVSQINFNKATLQYPDGEYLRSSRTIALYKVSVQGNGKTYLDICNPVIIQGRHKGVVRIGFLEY